ncbi:IPT/TIG domain-containing protein, partial [Huintestinicola sp.]|uniref:IPT/TIG domain-containing protein n=1 Tax=Huintestinicola sp. TaxID=2981661 RepID=UPI003D7D48B7
GTGFTDSTSVKIGTKSASNIVVSADGTSITCNLPSKSAGTYSVAVIEGTEKGYIDFTYTAKAPEPGLTIAGISISSAAAGTSPTVTITGTGFDDTTSVKIGTKSASNIIVSADGTSITCTLPSKSAGTYSIAVMVGTEKKYIDFTFV